MHACNWHTNYLSRYWLPIVRCSIPFTIVLPSLDMKQEMIDRYIKRGNQENFVTMLETNYETFVNDLMSDPNNKIVLDSGQYLKDVVRFI